MDQTYRFRFLLYLAAFMLVMSVCLVYAEPVTPSGHLLFQVAPQHSGFMAESAVQPSFDSAALRTAISPTVTPQTLQQLDRALRPSHSLLHRTRRAPLRLAPAFDRNESSAVPPQAQAPRAE